MCPIGFLEEYKTHTAVTTETQKAFPSLTLSYQKLTCELFLQALFLSESSGSELAALLPNRRFSSDVNTEQQDFCGGGEEMMKSLQT